ncbi:MAG TPA: glycerol-3-phosphate 1-O-acyltransferase PlsY [Pyrinomonadaceae bacterium]|nr:glycerol-3-phosphate 1-O-acyltransferase PlsY [Pyrinomonadaceae bacterium]
MVLVVIIAYLIGSIPFGYLIVRAKEGGDVRETGSGGTGATNVTRRAGRSAGVLTLILDAVKGALAIVVAQLLSNNEWSIAAAAIAVIVGHIFPVWLRFKGGKGVATGVGVFLVLAPFAVLCAGVVFLAVVWFTKYVSLGSILAAATIPLFVWLQAETRSLLTAAVIGALLIIFAHRANLTRLWNGTEARISDLKR